jgi:hypothetical protein
MGYTDDCLRKNQTERLAKITAYHRLGIIGRALAGRGPEAGAAPICPSAPRAHQSADYALLRAAVGHQRDDSQISLFWLSREGRTALQVRAMEGGSQV